MPYLNSNLEIKLFLIATNEPVVLETMAERSQLRQHGKETARHGGGSRQLSSAAVSFNNTWTCPPGAMMPKGIWLVGIYKRSQKL